MDDPQYIDGDGSGYIGKRLLVGVTYLSHLGEMIRQEQFHGLIVEADEHQVLIRRADTGELASLPPGLDKAVPGEYRLRSTGELVLNPDYLAKWTCTEPSPKENDS